MEKDVADARARAGVEAIFQRYHKLAETKSGELYDYDCMSRAELISVSAAESKVVYKFLPTQRYANLNNVMHGGAYGVLFDMLSMTALAQTGYWDMLGGVTRSLNISYLRAVPVNKPVYIHCHVVQHGRTMALIRAEMTNENGKVYATAEHHKVHIPAQEEHRKVRVPWDDEMEREEREKQERLKL